MAVWVVSAVECSDDTVGARSRETTFGCKISRIKKRNRFVCAHITDGGCRRGIDEGSFYKYGFFRNKTSGHKNMKRALWNLKKTKVSLGNTQNITTQI